MKLLLRLLFLPCLLLFGYFGAGALLALPGASPRQVDAVVVLGGGVGDRYPRGRELMLAGYSSRLLLLNASEMDHADAQRRLPGVSIIPLNGPHNTWQEAQAVRNWLLANDLKTVLVVSDPPHLLRVRYAWFSNLWGSDLACTLVASNPRWWYAWGWWQNSLSKDFVTSEALKLAYYVARYGLGIDLQRLSEYR